MFQLAGRLLSNPALLQRVGRSYLGKEGRGQLLASSVPGAIATTALGTITTGNPLAGLAIGAADLGASYGGARAISKLAPQYAGKYRAYVTPEQMSEGVPIDVQNLKQVYEPSMAQNAAMLLGSVGAPMALEPLFLQMQQQENTNQYVTQQQQLGQQEMLNNFYYPQTADGTLYQTQGLPPRVY
jgi:hypothetical protein